MGLGLGRVCTDGVRRHVHDDIEKLRRGDWRSGYEWIGTQEDWEREEIDKSKWRPRKDPQAQARANEIIAAWDEHKAACERLQDEIGLTAANEKCDALFDRVAALREQILETEAHTVRGLGVKASVAWYERPAWAIGDWREQDDPDERATVAVLSDVLRLAGRDGLLLRVE